MPGKKYITRLGVSYEIMPDGSERRMSKEESSSNTATNQFLHHEGSLGSKNNNPHRVGSKQSFDWNKKYGDAPPAITTSDDAQSAAMTRNMDAMGMLDSKNEEYIKDQKRSNSSIYQTGSKIIDSANRLGEKAGDKIEETGERLRNLGSRVKDKVEKKIKK